jgi:methylase of polypeptide subunit release factors
MLGNTRSSIQTWDRALAKHQLAKGSALDLGMGPGAQAFVLAQRGFRVTATDMSEDAIALAQERRRRDAGSAFSALSTTCGQPFGGRV